MASWLSRMFRSGTEKHARRAEVEGRFEDAARLWAEGGKREDACRVLMRAAETAQHSNDRRTYYARAYAVAPTDTLKREAKKGIGLVVLQESETVPPRNDEERARLAEAARDLETAESFREASRAWELLGDREAVERTLVLAGDIEGFERKADDEVERERVELRRRNVSESLVMLWKSGDRAGALAAADEWLVSHDDDEIRRMRDDRNAQLIADGRFEARIDGVATTYVGKFPCTLGREADVVLRGASVSREHCVIDLQGTDACVKDNGSRNGTLVEGMPLAGAVPLRVGLVFSLGADLALRVVESDAASTVMEVDRGMDRGRRVVIVRTASRTPMGRIKFDGRRAMFEPDGAVQLGSQRVAVPIMLSRGDRIERGGAVFEVVGAS